MCNMGNDFYTPAQVPSSRFPHSRRNAPYDGIECAHFKTCPSGASFDYFVRIFELLLSVFVFQNFMSDILFHSHIKIKIVPC